MLSERRMHDKLAEKLAIILVVAFRLRMSADDRLIRAAETHHQQYMRSLRPTQNEMIILVDLRCVEGFVEKTQVPPSLL